MASFTSSADKLGFIRLKDVPERSSMTKQLTISGVPDPGAPITLTKVGGASWLTVPSTCTHGVAFNVAIDLSNLPPEDVFKPVRRSETLRASYSGYTSLDIPITVEVRPGGPPR